MTNWWLRLIEPSNSIREPEQRRRAQLLSAVSFVAFCFSIPAILFTLLPSVRAGSPQATVPFLLIEFVGGACLFTAYRLARTRHYRAGAVLLTATMFAGAYGAVLFQGGDPFGIAFLAPVVLISSLFLSSRATAVTLAATMGAVVALPFLGVSLPRDAIYAAVFLLAYVGLLILVAATMQERDRQQIDRQTRALVETTQRLGSMMQSAPDGVISFNERGYIVGWNLAAESLFGYSEREALGRAVAIILPEMMHSTLERAVEHVLTTGEPQFLGQKSEFFGLRQQGSEFPVELSLAAWNSEGQKYITGVVRDVSERRQSHAALEEAHARLQETVSELREKTRQETLLAEMGELLQACTTPQEAYDVIANSAAHIFGGTSGGLCLLNASRTALERIKGWGQTARPQDTSHFAPDECWAVRRGRLHAVHDAATDLICRHVGEPPPSSYMCVPMIAQGESLGILFIAAAPGAAAQSDLGERLAVRTAEHIALALANIRLRETLRSQSIRDPLTNLYNRRFLEETLSREIRRSERSGNPLTVAMFDLDHFKGFNDSHGHAAGDALLRQLGTYLAESFRGGDVPCRYGGEEFIVLLPETDLEAGFSRAADLVRGVKQMAVRHQNKTLSGVTASAGVAAWQAGWTADTLLRAVDAALYRAKANGRNRVERAVEAGRLEEI